MVYPPSPRFPKEIEGTKGMTGDRIQRIGEGYIRWAAFSCLSMRPRKRGVGIGQAWVCQALGRLGDVHYPSYYEEKTHRGRPYSMICIEG